MPVCAATGEKEYGRTHTDIRNALLRFEPRIIPSSLVVSPKRQSAPGTTLWFEIAALLYWQPEPVGFAVSGSYDTETEKTTLTAL
ncbi:GPW/gp25 family protein [Cronobacter sakazakii]|uniref:GPW/gp25 family protein n=1 Tax=Cronobacter sakazakii TaxID=28141 RepID=A0AAN5X5H8_CROSK|nr:GPW/gp25 family protein [Cronobacter sakazakii]EGT4273894.1 hypothetical protein [Cronobacter sakazakii]EGT5692959.1 hypothetical protein [Cronobacter sakazakii]EGT5717527.1 hypothetical protein [Cronobacter sakazakii]EGT5724308.1 hypothetical protein [Cronobacter sakazakii]KAB0881182.1 GPW/gp25 family protein [Cronobacter sakazakii]